MELTKWKVRDKILSFPKNWNKEKVLQYVNQKNICICEICGKLDVGLNHYKDCNPAREANIQQRIQDYYD